MYFVLMLGQSVLLAIERLTSIWTDALTHSLAYQPAHISHRCVQVTDDDDVDDNEIKSEQKKKTIDVFFFSFSLSLSLCDHFNDDRRKKK